MEIKKEIFEKLAKKFSIGVEKIELFEKLEEWSAEELKDIEFLEDRIETIIEMFF